MTDPKYKEDLNSWHSWKKDPTPEKLSNLLDQMRPVITRAIQVNQGSLSPAVIEAEAKKHALKAFQTYNPNKDVKLSTHLTNCLQKVNRFNYKYQEIYSVPEHRRIKHTTFENAKQDLTEKLGREPSADELANELHWSRAEVARYLSESRHELSDTQSVPGNMFADTTKKEALMSYIYNDLTPKHKVIFEHLTGYNNKKVLPNDEIQKKVKMTQGQFYYARDLIRDHAEKSMGKFE